LKKNMKSSHSTLMLLGDQLFPLEYVKKINPDSIFMGEDYQLCRHFKHHKQKIVLFFAAMRQYAQDLEKSGFTVIYHKLAPGSIFSKLLAHVKASKVKKIHYFSIDDCYCRKDFLAQLQDFDLVEHTSPKFLGTIKDFKEYLNQSKNRS